MKPKRPRGQRRRRLKITSDTQLGLAWYSRQAWQRLREVADDVQGLDETYEAWEHEALAAIRDWQSRGRQIHKVSIDIEALVAWCRERNRRIDSNARAEYVTYLLQQSEQVGGLSTPPTVQIIWDPLKAEANIAKHRVTFAEAATVLLDPLAVTVFDAEHSQSEERWFTLGISSEGKLLAVSHTYHQPDDGAPPEVRIISGRDATRRERQQYENETR
jgi:uncharacterized DUF497 family protein